MIAVIPHKDDLFQLANFQKEIKKMMIARGFFFYSRPPLWFYLPNNFTAKNKEELKALCLQKVLMEKPYFKDGKLLSPLHFTIDEKLYTCEYTHLYPFNFKADDKILNEALQEGLSKRTVNDRKKILTLPKEFRIFRLGIAERLSENSMAISESLWVKLR